MHLTQRAVIYTTSSIKLFAGEGIFDAGEGMFDAGEGMFNAGNWTFALGKITFCTFTAGENAFVVAACDVFHVWR